MFDLLGDVRLTLEVSPHAGTRGAGSLERDLAMFPQVIREPDSLHATGPDNLHESVTIRDDVVTPHSRDLIETYGFAVRSGSVSDDVRSASSAQRRCSLRKLRSATMFLGP
jgi:hypothetical protein